MIKIYIDTNVFINAIENRDNNISKKVLIFLENIKDINIYLNDLSIINIHYIGRKSTEKSELNKTLKTIINSYNLISIDKNIIEDALNSNFKDFEDGIQYFCAKKVETDIIITSNTKDFKSSSIKILSPKEFYDKFIMEN
ncbi:PIN domain-containing protein [Aliarcobacter faecis]|uniref:type II toxin-antitoxin system VapC family toxin n=1 Tax=Aliarcobacter faecis TaxID=1564138 RepID=UPI00047BB954|nr:PIN domain-containing protein [Aliarcobacter faecis]QKF72885.1 PIN domain-containing protein [Aliarcobacter faecis]